MIEQIHAKQEHKPTLEYLEERVRHEAAAAVVATSIEATLIHVALATAYAKRFGEDSTLARHTLAAWVDEHRVW